MVRTAAAAGEAEAFYGAFQEYGWRAGKRSLGNARRQIPGKGFLKKAAEQAKPAAIAIYRGHIIRYVRQAVS